MTKKLKSYLNVIILRIDLKFTVCASITMKPKGTLHDYFSR